MKPKMILDSKMLAGAAAALAVGVGSFAALAQEQHELLVETDLQVDAKNAEQRERTFLGVQVKPVEEAVARQLPGVEEGLGLMVEEVTPDSPADKAGLKRYDVLTKLDDQLLVNAEQLQALVRRHKKGDEVKLTFLRKGESKTEAVTLDSRMMADAPKPAPGEWKGKIEDLRKLAPELGQRGWQWFHDQDGTFKFGGPNGQFHFFEAPRGKGRPDVTAKRSLSIHIENDEGSLKITREDGKTKVLAKGKDGGVLYDGPCDSKEDREKMPKEVREQVEEALKRVEDGSPDLPRGKKEARL